MAEKKTPAKKAEPTKSAATAKKTTPAKTTTTAKKVEPAKSTATAKKAEPAKTTATAKKAEPAKSTATAKKAEPAKSTATAKKAEPAKTTATAKKAEPVKTTATAKKAEPAKTTATAKKAEPAKTTATANKAEPENKASFADRKSSVKKETAEVSAALAAESAKNKPKKASADKKSSMVADTKQAKASKSKATGKSGGAATATMSSNKKKIIIISVAVLLVLILVLTLVLSLRACSNSNDPSNALGIESMYSNTTQVGASAEILGTVDRYKPVDGIKDGGLESGYPQYGKTLSLTTEQKNAILAENRSYCGVKTTNTGGVYTFMDENGYLYSGTRENPTQLTDANGKRQLFKHTASVGLYGGNVDDSEQAVIKQLTFRKRSYSSYYEVTGLYAPAGEVIKVQLTEEDMDATGGIVIHIGQALYNGQANNIWNARNFNRMPVILNTMYVDKTTAVFDEDTRIWTAYVGSFFGGPIYVRDETPEYTVTISGGVNYAHFILGSTTEEQYKEYSKSSAPYFDLEVWDSGVLHSGPVQYAKKFSYEDLRKAAVLWEKISIVSTKVVNQGIVFIYDPFVAAGAAVAFPGRRSVNCPASWMTDSLNYNSFVTSGSWGNMHEYHHNFQNYGVGDRGEVTNNGLNLVSYSLFTKVSAARQLSSYGGAGLSGWNQYTSATWALNRVNEGNIKSTNGLAVYATLLHNLGQDAYIKSTGSTNAAYFNKWAANTHQDFTYFATQITNYTGSVVTPAATEYPTFVPIASTYQTGRSYMYDGEKRYIETMQPFVIPYGKSYTFDLNPYEEYLGTNGQFNGQYKAGSVVVGNGFTAKLKEVKADGINGKVEKVSDGIYTFTPNTELLSGKIYATFEITTTSGEKTYNGKPLDDVDIVIEFQQSHETNKMVLERTTYTYSADKMYTDATAAFDNGFKGYDSVEQKADHSNPTQNANTDIWYYPDTEANRVAHPNWPDSYFIKDNQIAVIDGKLYFSQDGKFRIYLRGRVNCALYWSLDNTSYKLGGKVTDGSGDKFYPGDPNTYFDIEFNEGVVKVNDEVITSDYTNADRWLYIKEILIVQSTPMRSYIGVGSLQWAEPLYNMKYFKNGKELTEYEDGAEIRYYNAMGVQVPESVATNPEPTEPSTTATPNYANAYRQSYEFQKEFTSDYFYTKEYSYNYTYNNAFGGKQTVLEALNYTPYSASRDKADNLVDGNTGTYIHTNGSINASKPLTFTVDAGQEVTANRIIIQTQNRPNGDWYYPVDFTLYVSMDGENWDPVGEYTGQTRSGTTITTDLGKLVTFRYYKLGITKSSGTYCIITEVSFSEYYANTGGKQYSIDDAMLKYSGSWATQTIYSTYGHIAVGKKGATVEFEFEGTQLGILSTAGFSGDFEVTIDGKKVESTQYKTKGNERIVLAYMSQELASGKHKVKIKCNIKNTSIDSIVTWNKVPQE